MSELTDAVEAINRLIQLYGITRDQLADLLTGTADGGPGGNGLYPITMADGSVRLAPSPGRLEAVNAGAADLVADGSILLLVEDRAYATLAALNANLAPPAGKFGLVYSDSNPDLNAFYVKQGAAGAGGWALALPFGEIRRAVVQAEQAVANEATARAAATRSRPIRRRSMRCPSRSTSTLPTRRASWPARRWSAMARSTISRATPRRRRSACCPAAPTI